MRYTPSEIRSAFTLVKRATTIYGGVGATGGLPKVPAPAGVKVPGVTTPTPVSNPYAYNRLADYEKWFTPAGTFDAPKPKRPGFWASAGKSMAGTLGALPIPAYNQAQGLHMMPTNLGYNAQSFFGLGPGRSGLRNVAEGTAGALGDVLTGDWSQAGNELRQAWTQGLISPSRRAQEQGGKWQGSLSDWLTGVNKGTAPGKWYKPGEYPGAISQEMQNWLLHPIQTFRTRPSIVW